RPVLERDRPLRTEPARQALDLLLDGILPGLGRFANAPHPIQHRLAVAVSTIGTALFRRRRGRPVDFYGEIGPAFFIPAPPLPPPAGSTSRFSRRNWSRISHWRTAPSRRGICPGRRSTLCPSRIVNWRPSSTSRP